MLSFERFAKFVLESISLQFFSREGGLGAYAQSYSMQSIRPEICPLAYGWDFVEYNPDGRGLDIDLGYKYGTFEDLCHFNSRVLCGHP